MFDIGKLLGINIDPKKFNEYLAQIILRIDKVATAWERIAAAQERLADNSEKAIKINEKILETAERTGKESREALIKILTSKK